MKTYPEYEVIDLKDLKVTNMWKTVEYQYKGNDLQFPTHLFAQITSKWVDYLAGDINGMRIFKMNIHLENGLREHITSGTSRFIHHRGKA